LYGGTIHEFMYVMDVFTTRVSRFVLFAAEIMDEMKINLAAKTEVGQKG